MTIQQSINEKIKIFKNAIIDTGVFISGVEYISIGGNTHVDKNCILVGSSANLDLSYRYVKIRENLNYNGIKVEIIMGKNRHISQNTMIYGYGGVSIGNNTTMSVGSKIYSLTSIAYNWMAYLKTCVESIISQNYDKYELIISEVKNV